MSEGERGLEIVRDISEAVIGIQGASESEESRTIKGSVFAQHARQCVEKIRLVLVSTFLEGLPGTRAPASCLQIDE